MTNPVDLNERRKDKKSEHQITSKQAIEALESMIEIIKSDEFSETDVNMFLLTCLTEDGRSIEGMGINVGDELEALGVVARWNHMLNFMYEE